MDYKKEIIDRVQKISGKYSPYEVFCDWIKCSAIAILNAHTLPTSESWKEREKEYIDTMKKYEKEEGVVFSEMLVLLELELKVRERDVLGEIYSESEMGNKSTGQFFSPYGISQILQRISITNKKEKIYLYEPTCGSGGNIIAVAAGMKEKKIDYRRKLEVVAQDLDWKSVYMTYLQLSLLGISAICFQGDALEKLNKVIQEKSIFYTPEKIKQGMKWR